MKSIFALALTAALGVVALTPARLELRWYRGYYSTPYYGSYYYPNTAYYYSPGTTYVDPGVSTSYYVAPGTTYVAPRRLILRRPMVASTTRRRTTTATQATMGTGVGEAAGDARKFLTSRHTGP